MSEQKDENSKFNKWVLLILLLLIALLGFYIYNNYYYLSSDDLNTEEITKIENDEQGSSADKSAEKDQDSNLTVQDDGKTNDEIAKDEVNNDDIDNEKVETQGEKTNAHFDGKNQEDIDQKSKNKYDDEKELEDRLKEGQEGQDNRDENDEVNQTQKTAQENNEGIKSNEDLKTDYQNSEIRDSMIVRPEDLINDARDTNGFGRQIYLLLIGQDQESDVNKGKVQSDSIILANLKPEEKELNLIAILAHEKYQGKRILEYDRRQLMNLMEDFIGINPQYYFVINYEGFKEIVNLISGIEIVIEESFEVPDLNLYLKAGTNILSGQETLNYVRYHNPEEDQLSRIKRHQQVIEGFTDKIFQRNTLLDIPKVYKTVVESIKNVETNFDYELAIETYGFIKNNDDFDINYKVLELEEKN